MQLTNITWSIFFGKKSKLPTLSIYWFCRMLLIENLNQKPKYKKMGLVRTSYEVFKGKGEIVLYCEHLHSVLYKQPAKFKDKIQKK